MPQNITGKPSSPFLRDTLVRQNQTQIYAFKATQSASDKLLLNLKFLKPID